MRNVVLVAIVILLILACSTKTKKTTNQQAYCFITEIIDSNELSGYWHVDHFPERSPLVIDLPSEFVLNKNSLSKFGQPVEFARELTGGGTIFLIQEIIEEAENVKQIRFAYPPEGISGIATFSEKRGQWYLQKIELTES